MRQTFQQSSTPNHPHAPIQPAFPRCIITTVLLDWTFSHRTDSSSNRIMPLARMLGPKSGDRSAHRPSFPQIPTASRPFIAKLRGRYKFLDFPPELRLVIYEFLFSEVSQRKISSVVRYHLCTKAYEITSRFQRLLGHPSIPVFTGILRTCRQVHNEALPVLYDHATFVADLRPAGNKLEFGPGALRQLGLVKSLEVNISMSFPCKLAPKVGTGPRARRASWDGSSSIGAKNLVTGPPSPPVRARANSWAVLVPDQMCFLQYLRRLEALLQSFHNGANLRRLDITIDNKDASLDPQKVSSILGLMESRLRVRPSCIVTLHLDGRVMFQLGSEGVLRVSRFLDQIQP